VHAGHVSSPLPPSPPLARQTPEATNLRLQRRVLLPMVLAVSLALGWVLWPFFGTLLWSGVIALLFAPVHRWLLPRCHHRRNLAAALTLALVLVCVIIPLLLLSAAAARELTQFYAQLRSGEINPERYFRGVFGGLPDGLRRLLAQLGVANFSALQRGLSSALAKGGQPLATHALDWGQNTFDFIVSAGLATYLSFFFIRDGEHLARTVQHALPLPPAHKQELVRQFNTVVRATVKGNLLVAAIQGALGGLAFWYLDLGAAVLWGVLMAFLSLLPAVGAALVWLPVAVYLFMAGEVGASLGLVAWGVLVIGLVDNLLRPLLVGRDTRMPDYVVLITTLGGMAAFGINGFVIGPTVAALFVAVWHIQLHRQTAEPP
jgi:predicted PurR-regulated permease PerM